MNSYYTESTTPFYLSTQIVWYIVGVVETLLAFRFFFELISTEYSSSFSAFIFTLTDWLTAPFLSVFGLATASIGPEWTTVLAMLTYLLIGYGLVSLFLMGHPIANPSARLYNQDL